MSDDIAAAGDLVTGALAARAVDPAADNGTAGGTGRHDGGGLCLNCGTRLIGTHCHSCGQAEHVHRTLGAIGHDIAHGVFHFEGRMWRTLPMLVARPGALTRRYIAGERARFVSPLALFLFTVFAMFAIYSWVGPGDLGDIAGKGVVDTETGIARGKALTHARLAALQRERAAALAAGTPTTAIDRRIAEERQGLVALDTAATTVGTRRDGGDAHSSWPWLDHAIQKARANPSLIAYKVQSSAYKFSWALILLSTPFVALLFLWRRRFGLYDHAIFVTYSISFMSLLVIVLEIGLSTGIARGLFWTLAWVAPPVHMFVQLRGAYGLSVFSALWRTLMLMLFAGVTLTMFVLGLVAMGVAH